MHMANICLLYKKIGDYQIELGLLEYFVLAPVLGVIL